MFNQVNHRAARFQILLLPDIFCRLETSFSLAGPDFQLLHNQSRGHVSSDRYDRPHVRLHGSKTHRHVCRYEGRPAENNRHVSCSFYSRGRFTSFIFPLEDKEQ